MPEYSTEAGIGLTIAGIAIFVLGYAAIATDKVSKPAIALAGGALMVLLGILSQEQAFAHIDLNVIFLLMGMMVIAGILVKTGVFQYVAILAARWTGGSGVRMMVALALLTAVLSAFLDNVTTVVLIAPVTLFVASSLRLNPVPLFLAEIFASNLGGAATLIGDPPNILIGSAADLDFTAFLIHMAVPVMIMLPLYLGAAAIMFRRQLGVPVEHRHALAALRARDAITDVRTMWMGLGVLTLTIVGFLLQRVMGWEAATIAIAGAAVLMIVTNTDAHDAFQSVEWPSVLFFVGLFMMVGGLVELGVLNRVAEFAIGLTQGNVGATAVLLLWLSGFLSAAIDNIPYTATMLPVVQQMTAAGLNPDNVLWWALAMGADFGGNATIIGASANVILAGIAARQGHPISFRRFITYGIPITVGMLVFSTLWLWVRYLAFA